MHLADGRYERVVRLFQSVFGDAAITVGSDLQDAVALAWRLDLFGQPDPRRWQHLGRRRAAGSTCPLLLFHDVHVAMALAASGDWAAAELQLDRLRQRAKRTKNARCPRSSSR